MEEVRCKDVVDAVLEKTPPVFLMMLEDGIQNGEIMVEMPVYEPRRYNAAVNRFMFREFVEDE